MYLYMRVPARRRAYAPVLPQSGCDWRRGRGVIHPTTADWGVYLDETAQSKGAAEARELWHFIFNLSRMAKDAFFLAAWASTWTDCLASLQRKTLCACISTCTLNRCTCRSSSTCCCSKDIHQIGAEDMHRWIDVLNG